MRRAVAIAIALGVVGCAVEGRQATKAGTSSLTPIPCLVDEDCVDDNPCNNDWCATDMTCKHSAYNTMPGCCYAPAADPSTGLPWTPEEGKVFADSMCDDKDLCTGTPADPDHCEVATNTCVSGAPKVPCCATDEDCDDGDYCTKDACSVWGYCTNEFIEWCCWDSSQCPPNQVYPCLPMTCVAGKCITVIGSASCACCVDDSWCDANEPDWNPCTDEKCVVNLDATSPYFECAKCEHVPDPTCKQDLPYHEPFSFAGEIEDLGWSVIDYATPAKADWGLSDDPWKPGAPPDPALDFSWSPTTTMVATVATSPILDATYCETSTFNPAKKTTVQWRHEYRHEVNGKPVTLRAVASGDGFKTWLPLYRQGTTTPWEVTTQGDLEYDLESTEVPEALKFSSDLQVGFMVDTTDPAASTFDMRRWRIDDVTVGCGAANVFKKSVVFRCKDGAATCDQAVFDKKVGEYPAGTDLPELTLGVNDWYLILACYKDADANSASWMAFGYPTGYLDGAPLDAPGFVTFWQANTNLVAVKYACGNNLDYTFYAGLYVKPNGNDDYAGRYRVGLIVRDEASKPPIPQHEPFESLVKLDITVMIDSGYLVWTPNTWDDPAGVALRDAIQANGHKAQVIRDITKVGDLTKYDGVFATLGVRGKNHVVSDTEAMKLKGFLDAGGSVYLEGGDFWWTGPEGGQGHTVLHDFFDVLALGDGDLKLAGPIAGQGFLDGYGFDLDQGWQVNAWNDRLAAGTAVPGGLGGELLTVDGGEGAFATTVAYEAPSPVDGTKVYRTIASSFPFLGLVEKGMHTRVELMAAYIEFLGTGWGL